VDDAVHVSRTVPFEVTSSEQVDEKGSEDVDETSLLPPSKVTDSQQVDAKEPGSGQLVG
jgi:hypothetical protein